MTMEQILAPIKEDIKAFEAAKEAFKTWRKI